MRKLGIIFLLGFFSVPGISQPQMNYELSEIAGEYWKEWLWFGENLSLQKDGRFSFVSSTSNCFGHELKDSIVGDSRIADDTLILDAESIYQIEVHHEVVWEEDTFYLGSVTRDIVRLEYKDTLPPYARKLNISTLNGRLVLVQRKGYDIFGREGGDAYSNLIAAHNSGRSSFAEFTPPFLIKQPYKPVTYSELINFLPRKYHEYVLEKPVVAMVESYSFLPDTSDHGTYLKVKLNKGRKEDMHTDLQMGTHLDLYRSYYLRIHSVSAHSSIGHIRLPGKLDTVDKLIDLKFYSDYNRHWRKLIRK